MGKRFTYEAWQGLPRKDYPAPPAKKVANKVARESEEAMHRRVCEYLHMLRLRDSELHFNTDLSGIRLSRGVAARVANLRSQPGWSDLVLMKPGKGILHIELKRDGVKLRNKRGAWADDHVAEQAYMLRMARMSGAYAVFAVGYEEAVWAVEKWLNDPANLHSESKHPIF